jgi:hypothetical protein
MVVGFNHNFRYKGEIYHIQTEDSGLKSPNIVTLLYQGGTILASKKTSYADISKVDNLAQVVEELMKEQHKDMLRSLKAGEFDAVIERYQSRRQPGNRVEERGATAPPFRDRAGTFAEQVEQPAGVPPAAPGATPLQGPQPKTPPAAASKPRQQDTPVAKAPSPTVRQSIDDVILSYLFPEEDEK